MGYFKGSKASEIFENKYRKELFFKLCNLCFCKFNKLAINKVLMKIRSQFKKKRKNHSIIIPDFNLLSIGVLKEYRGRKTGISYNLIKEFEKIAIMSINEKYKPEKSKVYCSTLSAKSGNIVARKFYERCGYNIFLKNDEEVKYIKYYN